MATSGEGSAASLTAKGLDLLGTAMLAIPNQSVDVSVGDSEVRALLVGTGEAFGVHPLGGSPAAFDLTPGAYRRRSRSHTRRGGAHELRNEVVEELLTCVMGGKHTKQDNVLRRGSRSRGMESDQSRK